MINKYNKVVTGILVGIATIVVSYGIVSLVFELLASNEIIDQSYGEDDLVRQRTIWVIAICSNIIGIQYFSKRRSANIQRGIALLTFIAAAVWLFYFKDSLFIED